MHGLFGLPQELLDRIIELSLLVERLPPSFIPDSTTGCGRTAYTATQHFDSRSSAQEYIMYEDPAPEISNAAPLSLTSRRLRNTTRDAIARILASPDGLVFKLDLILVNEREVWPTWICVPALARKVRRVDVTLRIFGADAAVVQGALYTNHRQQTLNPLSVTDGHSSSLVWRFYYLLEHFLRQGLVSTPVTNNAPNSGLVVDCIDIHVIQSDAAEDLAKGVQYDSWIRARQQRPYMRREQPLYPESDELKKAVICTVPMRASWLAQFLRSNLIVLLSMGHSAALYGMILHKRIGQFRFLVDGQPFGAEESVHPGKILKKLNYTNPSETMGHLPVSERLDAFREWKQQAMQMRIERGWDVQETTTPNNSSH
ncbi:hypothetical protein BKA62DRAFT_687332 [Auriculariales sp. MPI-PUGE-AT-0066]|nr:hypothetical protein BKA62DRAFT_687332 [Auriculariales sp. MPI-PUGE-AT-0066]